MKHEHSNHVVSPFVSAGPRATFVRNRVLGYSRSGNVRSRTVYYLSAAPRARYRRCLCGAARPSPPGSGRCRGVSRWRRRPGSPPPPPPPGLLASLQQNHTHTKASSTLDATQGAKQTRTRRTHCNNRTSNTPSNMRQNWTWLHLFTSRLACYLNAMSPASLSPAETGCFQIHTSGVRILILVLRTDCC